MRAVENWVVLTKDKSETKSGILTQDRNVGIVISSNRSELIKKKVIFDSRKEYLSHGQYFFVPYENIMAILEE
ncbi:hypothetical protein QKV95_gp037 [Poseidoniales virus YSH_150918]|uniref:Uncharacterized protein n=1 Tax=Poseidoniales virus YSH_150918 TaxID=3071324 RepID=A0A976UBP4_9CAUD|nr:hypothetical protein QKV95_gp037 [Yangshan Harbor Poseidoniales virus]UVF62511.1 hypothetical protein [Poseidoniales virus YSH_150918]